MVLDQPIVCLNLAVGNSLKLHLAQRGIVYSNATPVTCNKSTPSEEGVDLLHVTGLRKAMGSWVGRKVGKCDRTCINRPLGAKHNF